MADPQVGDLLPRPGYLPTYSQPGGSGTPVTPGQTANQRTGWFYPGCGHSIRMWDIRDVSVGGAPKKAVCCPMCGYINSIRTQAEIAAILNSGGMIFG